MKVFFTVTFPENREKEQAEYPLCRADGASGLVYSATPDL